jgi:DNA-binding NarL/FixJ family response regulator
MKGIVVVGEASDGHEAIEAVARLHPDIILMDISMPGLNGLEATSRVTQQFEDTRVIILSMHVSEAYVLQALNAGASGYVVKKANSAELEMALTAVAKGETYFSSTASTHVVEYVKRNTRRGGAHAVLTTRQIEILRLIAQGHTGKEIASELNISVRTVEGHRGEIMERLGIHDVAGLVRYAIGMGLIEPLDE